MFGPGPDHVASFSSMTLAFTPTPITVIDGLKWCDAVVTNHHSGDQITSLIVMQSYSTIIEIRR